MTAYEPLAQWDTLVNGESLLGNFIGDPHRWSYTIETFAMMNRVREHLYYQAINEPLFLLERSIYSGHYVFAVNGNKQGFMTAAEWGAYRRFLRLSCLNACRLVDLSICRLTRLLRSNVLKSVDATRRPQFPLNTCSKCMIGTRSFWFRKSA
ncbi:MAG: deoxynucleoside kinase [Candidatus Competibacteraceae bacterium]|nr:deoxynucleoside kinase [Candidatus Competibacteraceae bacterium]